MNLKRIMLITLFVVSYSVFASPDKDFINAIQRGANAALTVRVLDDAKQPVGDAKVRVRFDSAFKASGEVKSLVTDSNGLARVIGRTGKCIHIVVALSVVVFRFSFSKNFVKGMVNVTAL